MWTVSRSSRSHLDSSRVDMSYFQDSLVRFKGTETCKDLVNLFENLLSESVNHRVDGIW